MSVPYALHAKTAESITGTVNYTETDPVFGASVAGGITAADTANWNVDMDTQLDSTDIVALGFVAVSGTASEGATLQIVGGIPTWVAAAQPATIGDFRDGGIVFWVNPTDNTKGLVVDLNDLSTSAPWGCLGTLIGANDTAIGTGAQNTVDILAGCTQANIAADLCANSTSGGFTDWFLPSEDELNEIFQNTAAIETALTNNGGSGFLTGFYWSSTEIGVLDVRVQLNSDTFTRNKGNTYNVRAVRAF